jgi:asparagine synthase (glutamine-hydrolysing)
MCGILAILNQSSSDDVVQTNFIRGSHRGPDRSSFLKLNNDRLSLGFHRLAINGLDMASDQPLKLSGCYLVANAEIFNHADLMRQMNAMPLTSSDCEVILHLYLKYGMHQTLQMIDGEFAFVLYDSNNRLLYSARDPYGVRPLYKATHPSGQIAFASEVKMIQFQGSEYCQHTPGTAEMYRDGILVEKLTYTCLPCVQPMSAPPEAIVRNGLYAAVRKRVLNTERPMACLLSGGLDSSIVTALVVQVRRELGMNEPLQTFSIGLEGAEDLRYASIMANFLGTAHTSVVLTEQDFFNAIPEVIWAIESYDTTTVRASVGNYLVAKHIAAWSEAKVVFNGDGSDELTGGYLYFHYAPDAISKDAECRRLLKDIHLFDALRSDKSISSNGLEARTPFLDNSFVQAYLSLPLEVRFPEGRAEKHLLRTAFHDMLPSEICWRRKEAFSDGVSSVNRSWYQIITEMIPAATQMAFQNYREMGAAGHLMPTTAEQYYYRSLFRFEPTLLPYFWMPKFVPAGDCSARTLSVWHAGYVS